jgi:hypothetical protein
VPVATQVLPIFPVFAGISGWCNIICIFYPLQHSNYSAPLTAYGSE